MAIFTAYNNEITLYEYINKNMLVISCTIYGIFCIIFNQYSINNLNNMNSYYPGNEKRFGLLIHDLYFCHQYTLLYLLIIKYSKEIVGTSTLALENIRLTSLLLLEFIKIMMISYQLYYKNNISLFEHTYYFNNDNGVKYLIAYGILSVSYAIKIYTLWMVMICLVVFAGFILLYIAFEEIKDLFKSIKIREPVDLELAEEQSLEN